MLAILAPGSPAGVDGYGEIERRSAVLLGGLNRLRFAAVIATLDSDFRTSDVIGASELNASAVSKELKHFADAGVLRKAAHGRWVRLHDPFWHGCRALMTDLDREFGDAATPTVLRPVKKSVEP